MGSAECLERPNLHFSETLTSELSLTAQWLLRNERVRTDATRVHLVFHHVAQLQHVRNTYSCQLVERLTCSSIVKLCRAVARKTGFVGPLTQVVQRSAIEDGSSKLDAQLLSGSTKHGLEYLTDIHTRRHTQRVEHPACPPDVRLC